MTPQERDVIAGIFDRLRQAANQPRDPEAESLIAERLREQPYAPYALAQAVYVQEQALAKLNHEVESLRAQLSQAGPAPAGGFLSGIFGGAAAPRAGSVPPVPPRADATAPSAAWNTQARGAADPSEQTKPGPWSNQQQPRGGGFMANALTTAAGVAGGVMLGNVLANAFGGGKPQTASDAGSGSSAPSQQAADDRTEQDRHDDAGYDQANYEDDDPGFDDGGGGDWA
ncbi:DUF2076 domain-containing protein [Bosea sp. (in: a-proteobacteria)]|uniref:DUF2076 domain-containing protein n=1 Tax=Bosea sp. (in: a-proteobacteria) TaxID=1871050 RepID=UPI00262A4BD5|nr:DUF2076 domain-containing protein [Bosea sp. (in: a-proteobacteria)]MCO5092482.1 DUF2076 domain-containing protein [Bosea sp. (in: a-proteobacteria)]